MTICDISIEITEPIARVVMVYYNGKAATLAIVFLITIALCPSDLQEVRTQFVTNKIISSNYATKQPISKLHCVEWCSREGQAGKCKTAGYKTHAKVCSLSTDYQHTLLDVANETNDVFLMEEALTCDIAEPLVGGPNPIADGHMTASSIYGTNYAAHFARLYVLNAWGGSQAELASPVPDSYLQIFQGNLDPDIAVSNSLATPVKALCLRLHPLFWNVFVAVRLEVKGCPPV